MEDRNQPQAREQEIVAAFWNRDETAIEAFTAYNGGRCYRIALGITEDAGCAEECVSDLCFRLCWRRRCLLTMRKPLFRRWRIIICGCSGKRRRAAEKVNAIKPHGRQFMRNKTLFLLLLILSVFLCVCSREPEGTLSESDESEIILSLYSDYYTGVQPPIINSVQ